MSGFHNNKSNESGIYLSTLPSATYPICLAVWVKYLKIISVIPCERQHTLDYLPTYLPTYLHMVFCYYDMCLYLPMYIETWVGAWTPMYCYTDNFRQASTYFVYFHLANYRT